MNGRYASICDGRGGGPILRQPGLRQHARAPRCDARAADAAMVPTRPLLGVIVAQDLCLDVRRRHHARVLSGRVALRPRRPRRRRRNPWRTNAGQRRPHQWQCEVVRRGRSSGIAASLGDHRRARRQQIIRWRLRVNRDASLFCRAPDSDASDRHARAAPDGWSGNAVRQHAARGAGRAAAQSPAQ